MRRETGKIVMFARAILRKILFVFMAVAFAAPVFAQEAAVVWPEPLTPEAVRELVARLSDDQVRALLLHRLDADAAAGAAAGEAGAGETLQAAGEGVFRVVADAIRGTPNLFAAQAAALDGFRAKLGESGETNLLVAILAALAAGLAAEFAVNRLFRASSMKEEALAEGEGIAAAARILFRRLMLELGGLLVFFLVGRAALLGVISDEARPFAAAIVTNVVLMPRIGIAFAKFVLAPHRPELRLIHADDHTAQFLYWRQAGLLLWAGLTIAIARLNALSGLPVGESKIAFWMGVVAHLYLIWVIWSAREGLRRIMMGADPDVTPLEARVARAYPVYGVAVVISGWVLANAIAGMGRFDLLASGAHFQTMALLLTAPALDTLVRGLVRALTPPLSGEGEAAVEAQAAMKRSWIHIGRVVAFALVTFWIAGIWGVSFETVAAAGVGAAAAARLFGVLMILAAGYIAWEFASLLVNRRLAQETGALGPDGEEAESGGEGGGVGASRLSTVLPLLLWFLKAAIVIMTVLIALGHVGIDITPLLAGAGVAGLAIGFGAQKLVTDIVSGAFFLIDDAFRTGEYLDIGGTVGTVEKISIRSMQLRHHKGPVHTIPYGGMDKITNFSRDWVIMKLKFTVPFDTDPNKVKKLFKKIGADLFADPNFGPDMLEPFKSQGVFDFDDVGMVIRGKFMAKPGKQFTLRKEIYNRVKAAFAENGVEFARREVRIAMPPGMQASDLSEEDKANVAAAAAEAAKAGGQAAQKP